jgi:hypothetical protein
MHPQVSTEGAFPTMADAMTSSDHFGDRLSPQRMAGCQRERGTIAHYGKPAVAYGVHCIPVVQHADFDVCFDLLGLICKVLST